MPIGSLASNERAVMAFQMESAQSPMSLAKQLVPHFSYAAATMATSVESMVQHLEIR